MLISLKVKGTYAMCTKSVRKEKIKGFSLKKLKLSKLSNIAQQLGIAKYKDDFPNHHPHI
jgi:hypothetical protein